MPKDVVAPKNWRWVKLSNVARLESGHTPSRRVPEYWGGEVPWVSLKDVSSLEGKYIFNTADRTTELGIANSSARMLPKGTVVFCRTASVGRAIILGREMATSQDFANWLCGPEILPEYLLAALLSSGAEFDREKQGSTHKTIYMPVLEEFHVLLPPVAEQQRIANILAAADALRVKRRAAIEEVDSLSQAILVEMFGDPAERAKREGVVPLVDLIDPERPISYGILMPGPDQPDGVKYVRVVDMKDGGIELAGIRKTTRTVSDSYRRSLLRPDDVLLSIRGHVGRAAIVPPELQDANITQDTARLAAARTIVPLFLREYLRTDFIQRWMARHTKGVAVQGINLGDVKKIPVAPPPLTLQQEFARRIAAVESLKAAHRASLAELDALFASLQHRAFRGEL